MDYQKRYEGKPVTISNQVPKYGENTWERGWIEIEKPKSNERLAEIDYWLNKDYKIWIIPATYGSFRIWVKQEK
jgi:hypothetical protein